MAHKKDRYRKYSYQSFTLSICIIIISNIILHINVCLNELLAWYDISRLATSFFTPNTFLQFVDDVPGDPFIHSIHNTKTYLNSWNWWIFIFLFSPLRFTLLVRVHFNVSPSCGIKFFDPKLVLLSFPAHFQFQCAVDCLPFFCLDFSNWYSLFAVL